MLFSLLRRRVQNELVLLKSRRRKRRGRLVKSARRQQVPCRWVDVLEDRTLLSGFPVAQQLRDFGKSSDAEKFTKSGGVVFFVADDGVHGPELWMTDGTTEGTVLVRDIRPGSQGSSPSQLTDVDGTLFFIASDSVNDTELWKSDGSVEGTVLVKDIRPGSSPSNPSRLLNVAGILHFTANDGTAGEELWKSDGTSSGTQLVRDIREGSEDSQVESLTVFDGQLYFRARRTSNSTIELWKSDGTNAGTVIESTMSPNRLTVSSDALFFTSTTSSVGEELWKLTGVGISLVKDIEPGAGGSSPQYLTDVDGILFFSVNDRVHGEVLWKSDGTEAGTVLVEDTLPGNPESLLNADGTLYFTVSGNSLWKSDGTSVGTTRVFSGPASSVTSFGSLVAFTADSQGGLIYFTDGTEVGTQPLRNAAGDELIGQGGEPRVRGIGDTLFSSATAGGTQLFQPHLVAQYDFGDAPESFPTLLDANGAHHTIANGFHLGASVDQEYNGSPTVDASGDAADEDGVTISGPLNAGASSTVTVVASAAGRLDAWVDFNSDGDWNDFGERVFSGVQLTAGSNELSLDVVPWALPNDKAYARFRFSSQGVTAPGGFAPDGEVEDYTVAINSPPNAVHDSYQLTAPGSLEVIAGNGVLANDTDLEGQSLSVSRILVSPQHGTVTLNGDGSFVYQYRAGFETVTDSFFYEVSDGAGGTDVGTATISISSPPVFDGETGQLTLQSTNGRLLFAINEVTGNVVLPEGAPSAAANAVKTIVVRGSAFNDFIDLRQATRSAMPLLTGVTVETGDGNDTVYGSEVNDNVSTGNGNDFLFGMGGNDVMDAGAGDDFLFGSAGRDVLIGGSGRDLLRGQGSSGDFLTGGPGIDVIDGGAGTDRLVESFPNSTNIRLSETHLHVDSETDEIRNIEVAEIWGGDGGVTIDARSFSGPVLLYGGAGDDRLFSGNGNDQLFGMAGDDILDSGSGNDWLLGAAGRDVLRAGDGDDVLRGQGSSGDRLIGGAGADLLDGGAGSDFLIRDDEDNIVMDALDLLFAG